MPSLRTPQGHAIAIPARRVTVGEAPSCDIPVARGHGLAAMHFRLQPWESGYFLEDCGSGLGTTVNGKSVSWVPLNHGDVIAAGELTMVYQSDDRGPLPAFPSSQVIAVETTLADQATVPVPTMEPEAPPAPPSWLPPEALLPPVTPVQMAAMELPPPPKARGKAGAVVALLVLAAVVGLALWFYYSRP